MRSYGIPFMTFLISLALSTTPTFADCAADCSYEFNLCTSGCSQCQCDYWYYSCLDGCQNADYDSDGFSDQLDNCPNNPNSDQADCDNDGSGNVCDGFNGSFVPVGKWIGCASKIKDSYYGYLAIEVRYQKRYVDVTACHSPDRWNHSRETGTCYGSCGGGATKENTCGAACWNTSTHACDQKALCGHEFPELDGANIGTNFCQPDTV